VTASVQQSSSSSKTVSIDGNASIGFSEDLISFDGGTEFHYNMESAQGAGSEVDVTITYTGWSDVPVQPAALTTVGGTSPSTVGWYAPQLLKEAYRNLQAGANAPSGLTFPRHWNSVDLDRFPMGQFNFLSTILITNYPTITLHYTAGDYAQFQESLATHTTGTVSVLGIPVASVSINTYNMDSHQNSSNSDFTVTLTPTPPTGVPPLLVTAHVIGGVVTSPAV
jgi:hypothetical protein